jgi:hypothetical protein
VGDFVGETMFFGEGAGAGAAFFSAGILVGAGAAWLGAGAAGAILDTFTGAFTVNEAQMLSTQMKMARPHVAFSMKSVVLR